MSSITDELARVNLDVGDVNEMVREAKLKYGTSCVDNSGNVVVLLQSRAFVDNKGICRTKHYLKHWYYNDVLSYHNLCELTCIGPPRVDDFSAVWTAIVQNRIVVNDANPRIWSLPDGIKWIGNIEELYNRECYDKITMDLETLTHALVFGTPGIGKTLYLQVFLVYLAQRTPKGQPPPTIHYMYYDVDKVVKLSFLGDGSVVNITNVLQAPKPHYLLSDSVDVNVPSGTILNLEVASDKEKNFNQFQKRIQEARKKGGEFVMAPFSFEELQSIKPADMVDQCAKFRYDIYGGSARNFVAEQLKRCLVLDVVEETLTILFPDIKTDYPDAWNIVAHEVSGQLTRKAPNDMRATVSSMMWHMLGDGSKMWASKFMEWLAAAIIDDHTSDIVDELERVIGKSGVGNLFEAMGHRKFVKSTVPFLLKPLLASLPQDKPVFESAEFKLPVVRFNTVDEICNLPNGTYGLPMGSFPVIDSIVQPRTLIQFTVSPVMHDVSLVKLH